MTKLRSQGLIRSIEALQPSAPVQLGGQWSFVPALSGRGAGSGDREISCSEQLGGDMSWYQYGMIVVSCAENNNILFDRKPCGASKRESTAQGTCSVYWSRMRN